MSKTIARLTAALLIASASSAFAASSTDLTVTGLITPAACEPSLSNNGIVDHGKIKAADLNQNAPTYLARKTIDFSVTCDGATPFALQGEDNRAGSEHESESFYFGLGLINSTEKLGAFQVNFTNPRADNRTATFIVSDNGGQNWQKLHSSFALRKSSDWVSVAAWGTETPIPVTTFTGQMQINTEIAPANQLTLTDDVTMDGSLTLNVIYL